MNDPERRLILVEPISDLCAICEIMPEFDISNPEEWAALEVAKAALADRQVWTGDPNIWPESPPLIAAGPELLNELEMTLLDLEAETEQLGCDKGHHDDGNPDFVDKCYACMRRDRIRLVIAKAKGQTVKEQANA